MLLDPDQTASDLCLHCFANAILLETLAYKILGNLYKKYQLMYLSSVFVQTGLSK